ncbi:MAG: DUF6152 family protein [Caulobacteraceae bacterium]
MTPRARFAVGAAAALATAAANPAAAHHSFALFDAQKSMTLEGQVKEFQWTNPHTWIQLVVVDASGKEVEWSIEGSSAAQMARQGWSRAALKPGDHAFVVIHPLKDGTRGGSLVSVTVNGQAIGAHG